MSITNSSAAVTVKRIKCRRWSDQVEELWLISYYNKPLCHAQTAKRAITIAQDTFPDDDIQVIQ